MIIALCELNHTWPKCIGSLREPRAQMTMGTLREKETCSRALENRIDNHPLNRTSCYGVSPKVSVK